MKKMDKRKTVTEVVVVVRKEEQKQKKGENEVFASCDFSSLGLHHTLCQQLRGLSFSLCIYVSIIIHFNVI